MALRPAELSQVFFSPADLLRVPRRRRLDIAIESYEALWSAFVDLHARLESLENLDAERDDQHEVESGVDATLSAAREEAEQVKAEARSRSEAALKKARRKADEIVADAERERRVLLEGERLRTRERKLYAEYVELLRVTIDRLSSEIEKIAGSNGGPARSAKQSQDTNGHSPSPSTGFPVAPQHP